jgi:hypothetical protein
VRDFDVVSGGEIRPPVDGSNRVTALNAVIPTSGFSEPHNLIETFLCRQPQRSPVTIVGYPNDMRGTADHRRTACL